LRRQPFARGLALRGVEALVAVLVELGNELPVLLHRAAEAAALGHHAALHDRQRDHSGKGGAERPRLPRSHSVLDVHGIPRVFWF
jgi:hypothetical protein